MIDAGRAIRSKSFRIDHEKMPKRCEENSDHRQAELFGKLPQSAMF
jgi:hypothetical protein